MLVENTDNYNGFMNHIKFQNADENISVEGSTRKESKNEIKKNLLLKNQRGNLIEVVESNDIIEKKIGECFTYPEGYQLLPERFYKCKKIPQPLVSSSWLRRVNSRSDGESREDSIPLAKLKKKFQRLGKIDSLNMTYIDNSDENVCEKNLIKHKKKVENKDFSVHRKRGRPKKQLIEKVTKSTTPPFENDFANTEALPVLNDASDFSKFVTNNLIKVNNEPDDDTLLINNYNEHDYFKQIDNAEKLKCQNKEEKAKRSKNLNSGVKIGNSKVSFPCLDCGKSFSALSTLKSHQRIHNGTLLVCPDCHKGFISKYLLKCHMRIHSGDLFMCHKCGRGFTTAELLKVHSRAHTGIRPFICDVCKKSFPTSSNMLQHKQIHNAEKKFLCSECGSSFVQKRCLDYHMLTHGEKKNICNVCGKLWARKSDLTEHMRIHTGVKPYRCSICPQKFSQASSLKRHQLVHMNVKPITCGTCRKLFKCQEYYKRHLRKHEKMNHAFNSDQT